MFQSSLDSVAVTTPAMQGLFILPPELRSIVWGYLLPPPKILRPEAKYSYTKSQQRLAPEDRVPRQWVLGFTQTPLHPPPTNHDQRLRSQYFSVECKPPVLSQLCQESRRFILSHGSFIFGKGAADGGVWWNPQADTLLFTYEWSTRHESCALAGLTGLDQVRNVAIDSDQARYISYHALYPKEFASTRSREWAVPREIILNLPKSRGCEHFFDYIKPTRLTVVFPRIGLFSRLVSRAALCTRTALLFDESSDEGFHRKHVTFNIGGDSFDLLVKKLTAYRGLWVALRESPALESESAVDGEYSKMRGRSTDSTDGHFHVKNPEVKDGTGTWFWVPWRAVIANRPEAL